MENPNIIISIGKGPMMGQVLECSPGSVIRIGRVVRGNTLAVKDPGISQKHIKVEYHREISQWTVTDLGTSNGTIVNAAVITPNAPFPLTDGDKVKIGENTLISVKISAPRLETEPRTRLGRRIASSSATLPTVVKEEKVAGLEKHVGNVDLHGNVCSESSNIDDAVKRVPKEGKRGRPRRGSTAACSINGPVEQEAVDVQEGKRGRPRRGSAAACSAKDPMEQEVVDVQEKADYLNKNRHSRRAQRKTSVLSAGDSRDNTALEPVREEWDCRDTECSSGVLKENDDFRNEKVEGPNKNGGKGRGCTKSGVESSRVLRKAAPLRPVVLEQKIGRVAKALSNSSSVKVMIMEEEARQALQKIDELFKNKDVGLIHTKRGGRPAKVSWKDEVLDPAILPPRRGRVTRASTMKMNYSSLAEKEHKEEDEKVKEGKVNETCKNRGKQRERSKSCRYPRTSRKDEVLESETGEKNTMQENEKPIAKDNTDGDGAMLVMEREARFVVEEGENHMDTTMSVDSSSTEGMLFPNKTELVCSWSSFSEIRGIPNTTSKYREDRTINCHATPFEERIEKVLNRGLAETSSGLEI